MKSKRLLSILICITMLIGLIPVMASAEGESISMEDVLVGDTPEDAV